MKIPTITRVLAKTIEDPTTGCWVFTGRSKTTDGYGRVADRWEGGKTKMVYPHRVAYEHFKGEIPEGLTIDHLCKNKACCNPEHLEAVTRRELAPHYRPAELPSEAPRPEATPCHSCWIRRDRHSGGCIT
jgi:hypothetical protein